MRENYVHRRIGSGYPGAHRANSYDDQNYLMPRLLAIVRLAGLCHGEFAHRGQLLDRNKFWEVDAVKRNCRPGGYLRSPDLRFG